MSRDLFPENTQVVVVGAGPTGLSLACRLARRGIDHVVIDHTPLIAANSQSAVVDTQTLEALDGIDVSSRLVPRGVEVTQFTLRDRDDHLASIDFTTLPSRYPHMLMVPESSAIEILAERLIAYGSRVIRPVTALGLEQHADGVSVQVWDGSSASAVPSRRSIFARYVVACDGMRSQIRSALEIPFVGPSRADIFVMADFRMRWPLPRTEVSLFLSGEGLLVVAPLPDDRYRILATTEQLIKNPDRDDVQSILSRRGLRTSPAIVHDLLWSEGFPVDRRLAMRYRSGHVFLAGDAAHVHSPTGAQGMNAGIQDALFLADKLADVIAGGADPAVLDHYENVRRPVAEAILKLTRRMASAATLRNRFAQQIRNRLLRFVGRLPVFRQGMARRISGLEWTRKSAPYTPLLPSSSPEPAAPDPDEERARSA